MSELPSVQPPQQLLELMARPYKKRDEILESSNRLVDYSYRLEHCSQDELEGLQSAINKEVNIIISGVNGLAPFLDNPGIIISIAQVTTILKSELESVGSNLQLQILPAYTIRTSLCPLANMTRLELTPKSFKKAYGIEIGIKDIMGLKWFSEHQQNNY
jgi:hypothetical protein